MRKGSELRCFFLKTYQFVFCEHSEGVQGKIHISIFILLNSRPPFYTLIYIYIYICTSKHAFRDLLNNSEGTFLSLLGSYRSSRLAVIQGDGMARLYRIFALLSFAFLLLLLGADARRIVAVGDLHGDLGQTIAVLQITGLIDLSKRWIGEDAYLVQVGDVLDVGPDDLKIVEFLMKLQKEAEAKGGDVVELLGNHEIRNLKGDFSGVMTSTLKADGGEKGREYLLSNATKLGRYLRSRKAIFHYGPFLFMHGGMSEATAELITDIKMVEEFNVKLSNALTNGTESALGRNGMNLNEDNEDEVANPILVRSLLNVRCSELDKLLTRKFPGIRSVVVGHVPHDPRDFDDWRLCNGSLMGIDFGLSRWKKGTTNHVAALEIDEATWHVQLIETTARYTPPYAVKKKSLIESMRANHVVRLILLASMIVGGMFLAAYFIPIRRRKSLQESLPTGDGHNYGTV